MIEIRKILKPWVFSTYPKGPKFWDRIGITGYGGFYIECKKNDLWSCGSGWDDMQLYDEVTAKKNLDEGLISKGYILCNSQDEVDKYMILL